MAKPSWVTLDKSSGTGEGSVNVTALQNSGSSTRSGSLTVKTASGLTKEVSITQQVFPTITLEENPILTNKDLEAVGGAAKIIFNVNDPATLPSPITLEYKHVFNPDKLLIQGIMASVCGLSSQEPDDQSYKLLSLNEEQSFSDPSGSIYRIGFKIGVGTYTGTKLGATAYFDIHLEVDGYQGTDLQLSVYQGVPR